MLYKLICDPNAQNQIIIYFLLKSSFIVIQPTGFLNSNFILFFKNNQF
jgi:hypothetical protein